MPIYSNLTDPYYLLPFSLLSAENSRNKFLVTLSVVPIVL